MNNISLPINRCAYIFIIHILFPFTIVQGEQLPSSDNLTTAVATVPLAQLLDRQDIFIAGQAETHTYRIPALITAMNGDLIAVCDARRQNASDLIYQRHIDIVMRRSSDNGTTWTPMEEICNYPDGRAASDPSLVIDQSSGEIFCLYNYMDHDLAPKEFRLYVQSSRNHGQTWGEARDITEQISLPEWKKDFKFITSGRGMQLQSGVLVHTLVNLKKGLHLFGSQDHGQTWSLLSGAIKPADESQFMELVDGTWMINARVNDKNGRRWIHLSNDEGKTWTTTKDDHLIDPACNASIIRYSAIRNGHDKNRLIFCNANSEKGRKNLAVRLSYDEGKTWPYAKVIDPGPAAYSSVTVCADGSIGVLYEPGYKSVRFVRFTISDLTDGNDQGIGK